LIPTNNEQLSIALRARKDELTIKESDQLALIGTGYDSIDEANIAGIEFQNALMVALASVRVGADFGDRAAKGMFTGYGLKWAEKLFNRKVLNNIHGLMTYQSDQEIRFVSMNGDLVRGTTLESFMLAFTNAIKKKPTITKRDLLAYSLFNGSFFQPKADSWFLLLVMAVEALIELAPRSTEATNHITSLIQETKSSELEENEKNSIIGSLRWLKKESINQSCKRLINKQLGNTIYADKTAEKFFTYCYNLRSDLVHGNIPTPTFKEIGSAAATLEVLVSDLLTNKNLA